MSVLGSATERVPQLLQCQVLRICPTTQNILRLHDLCVCSFLTCLIVQVKTTRHEANQKNTADMIVSPCSNRKKASIEAGLHAAELATGTVPDVAGQWRSWLETTPKPYTAQTLYGGRSFSEASWSAKATQMPHYIVSAGLGVVGPNDNIPSYAMTTAGSSNENVLKKCPTGTSASDWWNAAFPKGLMANLIGKAASRVFLALPSVYLEMVKDELLSLPIADLKKVRILTGSSDTLVAAKLRDLVLPYDSRLDGPDSPIPGTKSDFASRALRHFVGLTSDGSLLGDRRVVEGSLMGMRLPTRPKRIRLSDNEIRQALIAQWRHVQGNRNKLLRHLRDELLVSCEQSRFARLAREIEEERLV